MEVQGRERFEYYPTQTSQGERSSEEGSQILRKSNGILLFPNPAGASISVMLPNEMDWEGMQFQLCDFQGALLQADGSNGQMTGRTSEIPLTGLPPGIYLIKLTDGTGKLVESLKFVKQ